MAQKQELAEKIQEADGEILNKAIALIQASMPLGDVSLPFFLSSSLRITFLQPSGRLTLRFFLPVVCFAL
jgi:hypothetical protein